MEIEGFQYGFATIIISISDDNWVSVVSDGVRKSNYRNYNWLAR